MTNDLFGNEVRVWDNDFSHLPQYNFSCSMPTFICCHMEQCVFFKFLV